MLQGEHSAILLTCMKLPFVIKIFVLSSYEWPLKTGLTVFLTEKKLKEKKLYKIFALVIIPINDQSKCIILNSFLNSSIFFLEKK